jgi:ABC-type transport system involved in multi-copper enzyme maturation permease subunit
MKKILSIAYYTFIESVRNKVFYVLIFFGVTIVLASLLLAALGGEQPQRILLDVGLNAIEFFALLTVGFSAVTLVLEEMESKTIYLILTRPVSRITYLTGRYFGLLLAVYSGMLVMALMHIAILKLEGWEFVMRYPLAVMLSAGKITIIGSLSLFFSLFSTSAVSSISFTVFFWVLGHFMEEINFLSSKITNIIPKIFLKIFYYLLPNLQLFNLRDFWEVPNIIGNWMFVSFGYCVVYSALFISLSAWVFINKEF